MNTTDEIVDLRIWPLEASDRWGVRYHFKTATCMSRPRVALERDCDGRALAPAAGNCV